jgi:ribulose-5-phosphate 4-epimerase/fuculose-1-phosphate aldolase
MTADPTTSLDRDAARRLLAATAALLYERRHTELQGGNMSLRTGAEVVITPTRASDRWGWRLAPDETLVMDLDGAVLGGDPAKVSRETTLHLWLYRDFPEVGSVFHLHQAEALGAVAAGRWPSGVVTRSAEPYGAPLVVLEAGLPAQTEAHDSRVAALLAEVPRADGAISMSPGHALVSVARDVATNIRTVEVFRQRLRLERLRARLRSAAATGGAK